MPSPATSSTSARSRCSPCDRRRPTSSAGSGRPTSWSHPPRRPRRCGPAERCGRCRAPPSWACRRTRTPPGECSPTTRSSGCADERPWPGGPVTDDVSVGEYVSTRLGSAVVDRLVEPLLGGVYAGHAHALSLRATMPALWDRATRGESLLTARPAEPASRTGVVDRATVHDRPSPASVAGWAACPLCWPTSSPRGAPPCAPGPSCAGSSARGSGGGSSSARPPRPRCSTRRRSSSACRPPRLHASSRPTRPWRPPASPPSRRPRRPS